MAKRKDKIKKVVEDLSIPTLPPLGLEVYPARIPDRVQAYLRKSGPPLDEAPDETHVAALIKTVRLLIESAELKSYWRSLAGKALERDPQQVWRLADCIEIARTEGKRRGVLAPDRFAENLRWLARSRADREAHARRLAKRARELRDDLEGTPFDVSAYLALVLGKVERTPDEARSDGPRVSRVLDGVANYIDREAERSRARDLPSFRDTRDRLPRFVMSVVFTFHGSALGLSKTSSMRSAAHIASAVFEREFTESDARNAVRGL